MNSCLRVYAENFRAGRQEDAHEFLRYVIDACHNTCVRLKKMQEQQHRGKFGIANKEDVSESVETVVKEIFGGALRNQVKCLSCGAESNKTDEIMDISLDILHCGSLKEALQKFFQPEVLDGNNKYNCDNCKKLVAARKQMSILQAPNVLVIQLKRFEGMLGGKVDKPIAFDEILVLSSHMCEGSKDLHPEYNLVGTIVHSGFSPDSGHYYAYIKDTIGRWYCCNDSNVSVSTWQEVLSEKVYILFFSRTKQRPRTKGDLVVNGSKSHELNGSKTSVTQKLGSLDKAGRNKLVSSQLAEANNPTNGTRSFILKSGYLEKPINMKIAANSSETNDSTNHVASISTKTSTAQRSDLVETPSSVKKLAADHSEEYNSINSAGPNCSNSTEVQKLGAHLKPVDKESSNDQIQTSNSTKLEVEQPLPDKYRRFSDSVIANKLLASGNIKIAVCKKESREENGYAADIIGSSNSCMKRKIENGLKCIFLAQDDQSRVEVEAFKEVIGKEASEVLRSCGWSDEVHSFMHARKKLCQEAGGTVSNGREMKKLLISDAKRNFISKVPESLKASLIERLRLFSQEKRLSGT